MVALRRNRPEWIFAALLCLTGATSQTLRADDIPFSRVAPLFQKHCHGCHGIPKAKGKLRIDKLNPDFVKGNDGDHWRDVLDRLNFGDMPPASEPALKKEDRELMTAWLTQEHRRAALAKNQATHFRRLTRREYERTLQDLLGLAIEFSGRLPEDGRSKDGFKNDGDALRMSPLQYETYLQIADEALAEAIVTGPAPAVHRYRLSVGEKHSDFVIKPLTKPEGRHGETFEYDTKKGKAFSIRNMSAPNKDKDKDKDKIWDGTLTPSAIRRFGEAAVQMPERCYAFGFHQAFRKGETRIKVRAARVEPAEKVETARMPALTLAVGSTNFHGVELKTIGEPIVIDHTEYRDYEFRIRMENFSAPNTGPLNDRNSTVLAAWNSAKAIKGEPQPPRLKIEWIEFENPFFETWPPATHTNILFANNDLAEPEYAREVVRRFAARAYRGPLSPAEIDRLMAYWTKARANSDTLESSLRGQAEKVILIAGGKDKGLDYTENSGTIASSVRHAVLIGEMAERIASAWSGVVPCTQTASLEEAVEEALRVARPRERILFSPGTSSFDMFKNYAERGDVFRAIVNRL